MKKKRNNRRPGLSHRALGVDRERARVTIPREVEEQRREIMREREAETRDADEG